METSITQLCQDDIDCKQLEKDWGVTRNTIKSWAKALAVQLKRPNSTTSLWPGERLQDGEDLAEWLRADRKRKLGDFPIVAAVRARQEAITASKPEQLTAEAPANEALAKALLSLTAAVPARAQTCSRMSEGIIPSTPNQPSLLQSTASHDGSDQ